MKQKQDNMRILRKNICTILLFVFCKNISAQQIVITNTPWTYSIGPITEAGTDYTTVYESPSNHILISLQASLLLDNPKVSVHHEPNPLWHSSLQLAVRRTGNGTTGCLLCSVTGAQNYQSITSTPTALFNVFSVLSLANYNNIPFQVRLSGVSTTIPVANYETRIVFTLGAP